MSLKAVTGSSPTVSSEPLLEGLVNAQDELQQKTKDAYEQQIKLLQEQNTLLKENFTAKNEENARLVSELAISQAGAAALDRMRNKDVALIENLREDQIKLQNDLNKAKTAQAHLNLITECFTALSTFHHPPPDLREMWAICPLDAQSIETDWREGFHLGIANVPPHLRPMLNKIKAAQDATKLGNFNG